MADEKGKESKEEKEAPSAEGKGERGLSPDAKRREKEKKEKKAPEKKAVKKVDYGPDFKYIVRIANTDLDGAKKVDYALTGIRGVGIRLGTIIADVAGVNRYERIGKLSDSQIEALAKTVEEVAQKVPGWAVNRQFDWETGQDVHLIASNVDVVLRDDLNRLKKIRSYRGLRHEAGLPVRGQRTRSHGRTGLTVGVLRKKEEAPKEGEEKREGPRTGAKPLAGAKPAAPAAGAAPPAPGAKPAAAAKPAEAGKAEGGKK